MALLANGPSYLLAGATAAATGPLAYVFLKRAS
jgi:hypothetical protein